MGWTDDFDYAMKSLDLPVPSGLFADVTTAVGTIKSITGAMALKGGSATVGELAADGVLADALTAVAGVTAAFYAGACIGAAIYASAAAGYSFLSTEGAELASDVALIESELSYTQLLALAEALGS